VTRLVKERRHPITDSRNGNEDGAGPTAVRDETSGAQVEHDWAILDALPGERRLHEGAQRANTDVERIDQSTKCSIGE